MNHRYVIGNWKMHCSPDESRALTEEIVAGLKENPQVTVGVAPVALSLLTVLHSAKNGLLVGAQNCHFEKKGAFTGEISPEMLRMCGGQFAILGHSERRQYFGETDALIAARVQGVLKEGLIAVFCIGELLEARESGKTKEVLLRQLRAVLSQLDVSVKSADKLLIAYEPVWAIGTGKVATPLEITEAHQWIFEECEALGLHAPAILYGGSVTPQNFGEIITIPHVSGGLVGGASLSASKFLELVSLAQK